MDPITIPELFPGASDWLHDSRRSMVEERDVLTARWTAIQGEPTRQNWFRRLRDEGRLLDRLSGHLIRQARELQTARDDASRDLESRRWSIREGGGDPEADAAYHSDCLDLQCLVASCKTTSAASAECQKAIRDRRAKRHELGEA